MIDQLHRSLARSVAGPGPRLGPRGALLVFFWTVLAVVLAPDSRMPAVAALCLGALFLAFRNAPRRLYTRRGLLFFLLLMLPPLFVLGAADRTLMGIPYSSQGLCVSLAIGLRLVVVFTAAEGLSGVVDPSALAGVFEGVGLRGLGFALGVALNMLPSLQASSRTTWQAMQMRGGFRRLGVQAAHLLAVNLMCQTVRLAEEVALAAEARAFVPATAHPLPVTQGRWDRLAGWSGSLLLLVALAPWERLLCW